MAKGSISLKMRADELARAEVYPFHKNRKQAVDPTIMRSCTNFWLGGKMVKDDR